MTGNARWQEAAARFGRRLPAPAILIVALVVIQLSSGTAKTIMTADNASGLALFRLILGSVLLWLLIRPRVAGLSREAWIDVGLLGASFAFFNLAAYNALVHLPLGLAATIGFLGPLAVSLLGSRRRLDFVWPVLGFAGVVLLSPGNPGAEISWESMFFGLVYAASWALYIFASARAGKSMRGLDGFVVAGPIAALLLVPFGYDTVGHFVSSTEILQTAVFVTVTIACSLGLEYIALKRMEPRVFSVLLSLEPAIASLIGLMLLNEFLSGTSWIAILLVTIAASGAALAKTARASLFDLHRVDASTSALPEYLDDYSRSYWYIKTVLVEAKK